MHSNNLKSFEEIIHLRNKTVCARDIVTHFKLRRFDKREVHFGQS